MSGRRENSGGICHENLAELATAHVDSEGKPLEGANKYVLHFDKGALPPADAFWSPTMYDSAGFQVDGTWVPPAIKRVNQGAMRAGR